MDWQLTCAASRLGPFYQWRRGAVGTCRGTCRERGTWVHPHTKERIQFNRLPVAESALFGYGGWVGFGPSGTEINPSRPVLYLFRKYIRSDNFSFRFLSSTSKWSDLEVVQWSPNFGGLGWPPCCQFEPLVGDIADIADIASKWTSKSRSMPPPSPGAIRCGMSLYLCRVAFFRMHA